LRKTLFMAECNDARKVWEETMVEDAAPEWQEMLEWQHCEHKEKLSVAGVAAEAARWADTARAAARTQQNANKQDEEHSPTPSSSARNLQLLSKTGMAGGQLFGCF
jgi:hypothetical protein